MNAMDELEKKLVQELKDIPSGGGISVAFGTAKNSEAAAKIIRQMIELAVATAPRR